MLIEQIKLTNLLSFGPQSEAVALRPLNVVIGPNGSGKSNLLEAIELLRCVPEQVASPIRNGGGVDEWIWKGEGALPAATLEVVMRHPGLDQGMRYALSFSSVLQFFQVINESIDNNRDDDQLILYYGFESGRPSIVGDGRERIFADYLKKDCSVLSQLRDPERYPEFSYLSEMLPRISLYRDLGFGRNTVQRMPQKADLPNDVLEPDGRNLGLVLNRLRRDPETKRKLLAALRELYEGIDDYDVRVEGGTVQVFFHEGRMTIPATRLSDGTLRYLCLLAILCDPKPPPLVCIEEPELGLHPDILPTVARLLREASERCQLIVTTHSEALVDAMTDTPENVLVCEKHQGATTLRRLSAEELRPWLERYRLGALWTRGDLGGARW